MNRKEGVGVARTSSDSSGDTDTARLVNMPQTLPVTGHPMGAVPHAPCKLWH